MVSQLEQFFLIEWWQRRCANIELQMHCGRNLVDVLPAGPLRPDGVYIDLVIQEGYSR